MKEWQRSHCIRVYDIPLQGHHVPKWSLLVLCFAKCRYIATLTERGLRLLYVLVN